MIIKYLKKIILAVVSVLAFPFKAFAQSPSPTLTIVSVPPMTILPSGPSWVMFLGFGSLLMSWFSALILLPSTLIYGIVWHIKNKEKRKQLGYPWYEFFKTKIFITLAVIIIFSWLIYYFISLNTAYPSYY